MPAIDVADLGKTYGGASGPVRAIDGLSFTVESGEIYGLLGPNGAGKTSTVEILEGHRRPTSGEVTVLGERPGAAGRRWRDRVGIVLQSSGIEPEFTVREVVELYGGVYSNPRPVAEVVDLVDLGDRLDERVGALSGGQRRRLDLALGVVGRPEVLFLDEPTTGFDVTARRRAWDLITSLRDEGTTILLTTHYLEEAEQLADRVGVIVDGRMVAEGAPGALAGDLGATVISFTAPASLALDAVTDELTAVLGARPSVRSGVVEVRTTNPTEVTNALTRWALDRDVELTGLAVRRTSLEDVFVALTTSSDVEEPER
jgi:ABC-2 type transport system ATP-binding protein